MKNLLVISPHADDEILGCGGTLLKYKKKYNIQWILCTKMKEKDGYSKKIIREREKQIKHIKKKLDINKYVNLNYSPSTLAGLDENKIILSFKKILNKFNSNIVLIPYYGDAHSDHKVVTINVIKCLKWFRYKHIQKIYMYETLSETNFNFLYQNFKPNYYENIDNYLSGKIELMNVYKSEIQPFPFPRSKETIESLAKIRGSESGFKAAESFNLIYERND